MKWQICIQLIWCVSVAKSQYEPYGENVAYGKPAIQSTTLGVLNASLGVDGRISTDFDVAPCSHTGEGPMYAWWTVNLEGFYFIKFIRIYQWTKNSVNRLNGAQMYAKEMDNAWKQIHFSSSWPPSVFNVSVELSEPIGEIMLNNSLVQGAAAFICVCELQAFKVIECVPFFIANGSIEFVKYGDSRQNFTFGTKFNVTCYEGYRISDDGTLANETESTIECNANGNWSRNITCLVIDCGWPMNIPGNSILVYSTGLSGNTSYNATFTIHCNKGFRYTLPENETVRCGNEGHWTGYLGICEVTRCTEIVPPEHGVIVVEPGTDGRWSFNTTVVIICNTGYSLKGEMLIKCMETGRWTNALGNCLDYKGMNTSEDEKKTYLIAWTITGPLCLILLVTNIVTFLRFRRHNGLKRKKRNNVPDDLTTAHIANASDLRLQANEDNSSYDFVEDSNTETLKNKVNKSENNAMEPYDNLQMENRAKSEYDKLTFEKESSLKTTIKNEK